MSEIDFDTEKFICEVKERRALWDLTSDEYSNRNIKKQKWEEITMMFGGSGCLTTQEKNELCEYIDVSLFSLIYIVRYSYYLLL